MTPDEIAKAHAEWDALPGTPSDARVFITQELIGEIFNLDQAKARLKELVPYAAWLRLTLVPGGAWLEGWREKPFKQGPPPSWCPQRFKPRTGPIWDRLWCRD